jgi:hypothetical protein
LRRVTRRSVMAYANELGMDVRVLWLHGFVRWIENEPVLDEGGQADCPRDAQALGAAGGGWVGRSLRLPLIPSQRQITQGRVASAYA